MKVTRTRVEEGEAVQYDGTADSMMRIGRLFYDWSIRVDEERGIYLARPGHSGHHLAVGTWVVKGATNSSPMFAKDLDSLRKCGYSWEEALDE